MSSPTPFSFQALLALPILPGLAPDQLPFNASGVFNSAVPGVELNFTGSGTKVVDLGTIASPGAKFLAVQYDALAGGAPITLTVGAATPIELSTGGFFVLSNPAPATGVTALSITYAGACTVRVWALG